MVVEVQQAVPDFSSLTMFRPDRPSGLLGWSHGELGPYHLQRDRPAVQSPGVVQWRQGVGGDCHRARAGSHGKAGMHVTPRILTYWFLKTGWITERLTTGPIWMKSDRSFDPYDLSFFFNSILELENAQKFNLIMLFIKAVLSCSNTVILLRLWMWQCFVLPVVWELGDNTLVEWLVAQRRLCNLRLLSWSGLCGEGLGNGEPSVRDRARDRQWVWPDTAGPAGLWHTSMSPGHWPSHMVRDVSISRKNWSFWMRSPVWWVWTPWLPPTHSHPKRRTSTRLPTLASCLIASPTARYSHPDLIFDLFVSESFTLLLYRSVMLPRILSPHGLIEHVFNLLTINTHTNIITLCKRD